MSKSANYRAIKGAALAMAAAAGMASAADVIWDNGSADLLWNTSSLNWTGAAWNNAAGDGAVFNGLGTGTITVSPVTARSVDFQTGGYTLAGAGPLTLTSAGSGTLAAGSMNVAVGSAATVNTPISSTIGLRKLGQGILELGGGSAISGGTSLSGTTGAVSAEVLVGDANGLTNGGVLTLLNAGVLAPTTKVGVTWGTLDLGANNVTLGGLAFRNPAPNAVTGTGTLKVNGDIHVVGDFSASSGNVITPNIDLGGGTQVVRVGVITFFAGQNACIFTGSLSNGSLFKTHGFQVTGNMGNSDGMALYGNNTYTGSTTLNNGGNVATGTNATTSVLVSGAGILSGLTLQGVDGSLGSATSIRVVGGSRLALDNNAAITSANPLVPSFPSFQNNNRVRDDASIELRDGSLTFVGQSMAAATETFGSLTLAGGHNIVTVTPTTPASGGTAALTCAGALTMASRATMSVNTPSAAPLGGPASQFFINGAMPAADATGILPRIVGNNTADFLTYSPVTGLTPYAGYTVNSFATPGVNVAVSAATATAGSVAINALKSTAAVTTTLSGADVLTVSSGMMYAASGTHTLGGTGTLDFGATTGVFFGGHTLPATASLTGTQGLIVASGTQTMAGNLAGLTGLVTVNSGTLNLNTATFTGSVEVRSGTLSLGVSQTSLGTVTMGVAAQESNLMGTVPSLSISAAGAGATINANVVVDNGTQTIGGNPLPTSFQVGMSPLSNTTGSQTLSGNFTLNSPFRLQGGGGGGTGATIFTGTMTGPALFYVTNGRVTFSPTSTISMAGGLIMGNSGNTMVAQFQGTAVGAAPMVVIGGNNNVVSYAGASSIFSGPITVQNAAGNTAPRFAPLSNSTIGNSFTLNGDAIAVVGAGITATWSGPISGASALSKTTVTTTGLTDNTGTLVLSNASNPYTGAMTVNAGTLVVNGGFPGASATATTAGTLAGTGTIGGAVAINAGGILAPGASIGTLNTGNLSVAGELLCEVDLGGAGAADLVNVTGTVTLSGNLNVSAVNPGASKTFIIVQNDGADAVSGTFGAVLNAPAGATVDYAFTGTDSLGRIGDGNDVALVVAGGGCYANCDASTAAPILNVADFTCFLQKYAGGDLYANCDQSTAAPVLNVADFTCFLTKYAAGCP